MKVDCDVIKDLLPSYSDKISSDSTNKLVKEHLQTCESCSKTLQDMNKKIDNKSIKNQEEINYLKGYKKKKTKTVIVAIIITILVVIDILLLITSWFYDKEFYVDINELYTEGWQIKDTEGERVGFYLEDQKYILLYDEIKNETDKSIHIKVTGMYWWGKADPAQYSTEIDENINTIYLEDIKGNLKEIWNKDKGILIKNVTYKEKLNREFTKEIENKIIEENKKLQESK